METTIKRLVDLSYKLKKYAEAFKCLLPSETNDYFFLQLAYIYVIFLSIHALQQELINITVISQLLNNPFTCSFVVYFYIYSKNIKNTAKIVAAILSVHIMLKFLEYSMLVVVEFQEIIQTALIYISAAAASLLIMYIIFKALSKLSLPAFFRRSQQRQAPQTRYSSARQTSYRSSIRSRHRLPLDESNYTTEEMRRRIFEIGNNQ